MTEALINGRIVWSHPLRAKKKQYMDGPNKGRDILGKDGQPVMEYSFGLAVPKMTTLQAMQQQGQNVDLGMAFENAVWPHMAAEIATGYPNGVPPRFSYKYHDGDGNDHEGKPFNLREGYAGHYVLTVSTVAGPPSLWKFNPQSGQYDQQNEDAVKCGDFLRAGISFKVNVATGTHTPSIYVNPTALEIAGYGSEIRTTVDPRSLFGGQAAPMLPGASAMPIAPQTGAALPGMGQQGQQPMQGGMPGQQPMQQQPAQQPMQQQPMQGGMPGQQPMHQQPMQQQPMQGGMPGQQPMHQQPAQGNYPAPAHDFVQNAGQQPMQYQQPMQQQPMQGGMPGQQPMQGGGMPMMPGQMPPR